MRHAGDLRAEVFGLGPDPDPDRIAELLRVRPDLADPVPESLEMLAWWASSRASLQMCLDRLDRFSCQVVQILALAAPAPSVSEVMDLLGPEKTDVADLDACIDRLAARCLVARHGDICEVHPALCAIRDPAGLGPSAQALLERLTVDRIAALAENLALPVAVSGARKAPLVDAVARELADGERIRRVLEQAPEEMVSLAMRLSAGPPSISTSGAFWTTYSKSAAPNTWRSPHLWLARMGIVIENDWYEAVMPREIALVLRGGRPFADLIAVRPRLVTSPVDQDEVDRSCAVAAMALTTATEKLVEAWSATPATLLKAGGIGTRELRKLADAVGLPELDAAVVVELARWSGLVEADELTSRALPTDSADEWLDSDLERRWAWLASSWVDAPCFFSLSGARDSRGKMQPPLFEWGELDVAAEHRRAVMGAFSEAGEGNGLDAVSVLDRTDWDAPLLMAQGPANVPTHVHWVCREAELLGFVSARSLSSFGRAVLEGEPERAEKLLSELLPEATSTVVFQADLTGIAAGRLHVRIRKELDLIADVESSGAAVIYRFSETSIRRGLDAGVSSGQIAAFLESVAAKGVPQPLAYLVADVGRRHGTMRVGTAASYVRFMDEATAAEVLRSKKTQRLSLRQLSPTVLVADVGQSTVLDVLRSAGYLPAAEEADGTVVTEGVAKHRALPSVIPSARRDALTSALEAGDYRVGASMEIALQILGRP